MAKPKYDVFLSHATADKPMVEELARLLVDKGLTPWFDQWDLVPGEPWQEAIERALEECPACAVCIGASGLGGWQKEEMNGAIQLQIARKRGRVIPVLLPGAERGERSALPLFLSGRAWVDFYRSLAEERALRRLIAGIRGERPGPDLGRAVSSGACPYRGLEHFDVWDSALFHGREDLTGWLLAKLRPTRPENRFLSIVGPSGSGKSSLARAGLLGSLKDGEIPGSEDWRLAVCRPGQRPLESLAITLRPDDSPAEVHDLMHRLAGDETMLHLITRLALESAPKESRFVLLVDQFEEVFTVCREEAQRQAFIDNLLYAAQEPKGRTAVVLTLRSDFYGECTRYPDLAAAISDRTELVGPMAKGELRKAIEEPARLTGFQLEGGLAELLIDDVLGEIGGLPLLEHALLQIWEARVGLQLRVEAFLAIGRVGGALDRHAEGIFSRFTSAQQEACRHLFLRLVLVEENREVIKRRLAIEELIRDQDDEPVRQASSSVLAELTRERLLTAGDEERPTVELAHEALVTHWNRLAQWIEGDRAALQTRGRLDDAVREWQRERQDPNFLLKGGRLVQIEEWARNHPAELGQQAQKLLMESLAARNQEQRRLKIGAITAAVIAAIAVLAAGFALIQSHVAEQRRQIARAEEIAERSRTAGSTDPQLGLLLALQSVKMAERAGEPYLPSAQSALRWALSQSGGIPLPSGVVQTMVMTANRKFLVTLGADLHLRRWSLAVEIPPLPMRDLGEVPEGPWPNLAVSPDGHWLLISSAEGCELLDLSDPTAKVDGSAFLRGEIGTGRSQAFSPDGRWLTTIMDGYLRLRDLRNPALKPITPFSREPLGALAFSPDGQILATLSSRGLLERWNLSTLSAYSEPLRLKGSPHQVAFSLDGKSLVTARVAAAKFLMNGQEEKREIENGIRQLDGCAVLGRIVRDGDGRFLACVSGASGAKVWKPGGEAGKPAISWLLRAQAIDLSMDSHWFAVGDLDGRVYLQPNIDSKEQDGEFNLLTTQAAPAHVVGFSKSGGWLVIQGGTEAPRLWDLRASMGAASGEPKLIMAKDTMLTRATARGELLQQNQVSGQLRLSKLDKIAASVVFPISDTISSEAAMSADGKWFAASRNRRDLLVWRLGSGGRVAPPIELPTVLEPERLQLSPHGRWLAVSDLNGNAQLWDLQNPRSRPRTVTPTRYIFAMAFSPLEDRLATLEDEGEIHMYKLGEAADLVPGILLFKDAEKRTNALVFSSDGNWLAVGGRDNRIQLWRINGSDEIFLENRTGPLMSLTFSPDGQWLAAVGGEAGTIQLWKWAGRNTNPTPILLTGHTKVVYSIVFAPQGLLSSSHDGTVRLWELNNGKLAALACQSAGRTLSYREWQTYLLSEPYQADEPCPGLPEDPE